MLDESNLHKGEVKALCRILTAMEKGRNDGAGVRAVKDIVKTLKGGDVKCAKKLCHEKSEDLLLYPDIRRVIHDLIEPIGYWDLETGMLTNY